MSLGGEHVAVLGENLGLDGLVELVIAPRRGDEVAGPLLVAFFQIDTGKRRLAGARLRTRRGEERLDRLGTDIVEEKGGLGLLAQIVLSRPIGVGEAELLDLFGAPVDAVRPIAIPEREGARRFVLDPRRCRGAAVMQDVPKSR